MFSRFIISKTEIYTYTRRTKTEKRIILCFCVCQKYPNKELHPDGKETLWDARKGFTLPSHLISYAGVVFCQTQIGNETFKSPLYIVAVVGKKSFPQRTLDRFYWEIIQDYFQLLRSWMFLTHRGIGWTNIGAHFIKSVVLNIQQNMFIKLCIHS